MPSPDAAAAVMLVEDDPILRETMAMALDVTGWPVFPAADGRTALALLRAHPEVAVMVSDIGLPDIDGLNLLQQATALRQDETLALAVVMITGQSGLAPARAAMRGGAVEFLAKPFRLDEFINAARHAMSLAMSRRGEAARRARQRGGAAAAGGP
jgi:DNA-binding NtrC family response regulator